MENYFLASLEKVANVPWDILYVFPKERKVTAWCWKKLRLVNEQQMSHFSQLQLLSIGKPQIKYFNLSMYISVTKDQKWNYYDQMESFVFRNHSIYSKCLFCFGNLSIFHVVEMESLSIGAFSFGPTRSTVHYFLINKISRCKNNTTPNDVLFVIWPRIFRVSITDWIKAMWGFWIIDFNTLSFRYPIPQN